jgi:cytochrome c
MNGRWIQGIALACFAFAVPAHAGSPTKGAVVFKKCAICHSVEKGQRASLGPNLFGIVGRKAGTGAFAYSAAMKTAAIVWTPANLDAYLLKPSAKVKGTKMSFAGLADANDRADVVAFLKSKK